MRKPKSHQRTEILNLVHYKKKSYFEQTMNSRVMNEFTFLKF